jgi:hypothetical protein
MRLSLLLLEMKLVVGDMAALREKYHTGQEEKMG